MQPPIGTLEVLQAAAAIAKTTQTLIGKEIDCKGISFITLFFAYVKGDETGLIITPSVLDKLTGTVYPYAIQTATGGAMTLTDTKITLTASKSSYMTFDVRGIDAFKFTQGGSANDGTPTGTLAASILMK
jgi:hypothetical protein